VQALKSCKLPELADDCCRFVKSRGIFWAFLQTQQLGGTEEISELNGAMSIIPSVWLAIISLIWVIIEFLMPLNHMTNACSNSAAALNHPLSLSGTIPQPQLASYLTHSTASCQSLCTATSHSTPSSLLRHDQPHVFASCCSVVPTTLHISWSKTIR